MPRRDVAPPKRPTAWGLLLGLIAVGVAVAEIGWSLQTHNFVEGALAVHGNALASLKWSCWFLAVALLFLPSVRNRLVEALEGASPNSSPASRLGLLLIGTSFATTLIFLKYCQYRGSQFPEDTAVMVQRAFNTSHGRWFQSSVYGVNYLSIHFACTMDLFSPVLWLWRSALPLLILQSCAIASMGPAVYLLAARLSRSAYAGYIGMLLAYSCPAYAELCGASLNDGALLAPFLLWALVFFEYERFVWGVVFMALAAITREHFPFSLAGLGLAVVFRSGRPTASNLRTGAALVAGAAALWVAEMKLINSFPVNFQNAYWQSFAKTYGSPADGGYGSLFLHFLRHPLTVFLKTIVPLDRALPAMKLLFFAGLFPLAAPAELLGLGVALAPQMLSVNGPFHDMLLHYPSLVFGLLMYAAAHGLARIYRLLREHRREGLLLIPVLAISGLGFANSENPILPHWRTHMFDAMPSMAAKIPPGASLWADEYLAAWSAARAQLKLITFPGFDLDEFSRGLFRPDYVLLQKGWIIQADPAGRDAILVYLADHEYAKVADGPDIVLLRAPDPLSSEAGSLAATLPVPRREQQLAIADITQRLWKMEHGQAAPASPMTDEERRIEEYCARILLR